MARGPLGGSQIFAHKIVRSMADIITPEKMAPASSRFIMIIIEWLKRQTCCLNINVRFYVTRMR